MLGPIVVLAKTRGCLAQLWCERRGLRQRAVGVSVALIIYYGKPGLESQVFHSYMASSGYRVKVVDNCDGASSALDADPDAIVVIALDQEPHELIHHAEVLRAHAKHDSHIFVISPAESPETQLSGIDVIPQPYRLSELVRRIRALAQETQSH